MAGFSTTSGGLNFQYPNRDTENWDAVMANSFTTISSHDHSRDTAGRGNALTDRSLLLNNAGWLQSKDLAGSGLVNLIRATTSDSVALGGSLDALTVDNATDLNGTLDVAGVTVLSATLGVTGATTLSSTLDVTGATVLSATLGVTGAATLSSTLGVTGATTLLSTLSVTSAATFTAGLISNGDIDVKTNEIKTTTVDGDIVLTPNGTGRVQLGTVRVENAAGTKGHFLMTDGTSAADFKTAGWEEVATYSPTGGETEYVYDLSAYSSEYQEWIIFMDGVGGSVSSYPTIEARTSASAAITATYLRTNTVYSRTNATAIYGPTTNGTGTAKIAFVRVKYNAIAGAVRTLIDGYFVNTAGTNMAVFGDLNGVAGELVFKHAAGTLAASGTIKLFGKRS